MSFFSVRGVHFFFLFSWLVLICISFFENPLIFDDNYFFLKGAPEAYVDDGVRFSPRWWVYETLAVTFVYLGSGIAWQRVGNLFAHMSTVLVLYFFIRQLLLIFDAPGKLNIRVGVHFSAFLGAALFAVHPLSIFSQGYLIQRTIIFATLFSIFSLFSFLRGINGSRFWLWLSCPLFGLAVFAKEHVVMLPLVSTLLLVLYVRSGFIVQVSRREIFAVLLVQGLLSVLVVLQSAGIIGVPYEVLTEEVLISETERPVKNLYLLSVFNQAGLFFKYLHMWFLPVSTMMSVDMREVFPLGFYSWSLWRGVALFFAYIGFGFILLLRGGSLGLLGFSLLMPGVLFVTEFSVVRLQEVFVLYRSYLWGAGLFILFALGARRLSPRFLFSLAFFCVLYLSALSFDRLSTLAHPYLVWDEAARLYERTSEHSKVYGGYRIYYNRGNELYRQGRLDLAMADFNRVVDLNPAYSHAYQQRGVIYLDQKNWMGAKAEFEMSGLMSPGNSKSYIGLSRALEGLGQFRAADSALKKACSLGSQFACGEIKEL